MSSGRLLSVSRGVYAAVPFGIDPERFQPDPFLVASSVRSDAVFSHYRAITLLGAARYPLARIHADPDHSALEPREILIGHSAQGRLLLVAFTDRRGRLRLISAREVTRRERRDYEESQQGRS
jgi:uncharacterized DUF497 family protein